MHWDLENRERLIDRVSLEVSLKPFWDLSQAGIDRTATELFEQWMPLLRKAGRASVMMWLADGSEILEYRGRPEDTFEWAKWIGMADPHSLSREQPDMYDLHARPELYRADAPDMAYADVRRIVAALKRAGERLTGAPVEVGATFDPGGEFARSDFKFGRHGEIAAHRLDGGIFRWVTSTSTLHADSQPYAGFPEGIAEGTPLGTFLGRQAQHFLRDMDMDFLWFSNGFAFAANAWSITGQLFDGEAFDNQRAEALRADILRFWTLFRAECPTYRIECRGSNLGTGMDLSAHGSPLKAIYEGGFNLSAPPNSPWAALDGNYGLELAGWMSHIAELPDSGLFPFRYYTHDPWWLNSPWFDRYGRYPHDIYLPLALARFDGQGRVTKPTCINFLSADTSYGELPDRCPIDVTTHLVKALDDFPDAPGLLTWVYPFDEYDDFVRQNRLGEPFFGDWYVTGAINRGLPVSGVISTGNLATCADTFADAALLSPVPDAGSPMEAALIAAAMAGAKLLLYGPVDRASERMLAAIGVTRGEAAVGELRLRTDLPGDTSAQGQASDRLEHVPLYSGGALNTRADGQAQVIAEAVDAQGARFAYATFSPDAFAGAGTVWVRGSFNYTIRPRLPKPFAASERYPSDALPRLALACLGITLRNDKRGVDQRDPLVICARRDGGYYLSGYNPVTTTGLRLRLEHGAPLLIGTDTWLDGGEAVYAMPRAWHHECRVLVDGQTQGDLSCAESFPLFTLYRRRIIVRGLDGARVTILPETIKAQPLLLFDGESNSEMPKESLPYKAYPDGRCEIEGVSGTLQITW